MGNGQYQLNFSGLIQDGEIVVSINNLSNANGEDVDTVSLVYNGEYSSPIFTTDPADGDTVDFSFNQIEVTSTGQ